MTPDFKILVDGEDVSPRLRPRLSTLTLTERRDEAADQLELVLADHDGQLAVPRVGGEIILQIGWRGQPLTPKGRFKIDEVEHSGAPDVFSIKARSADFTQGLRIRRHEALTGATLNQVIGAIAQRQGLEAAVAPALGSRPVAVLEQSGESDAALLSRLGRENDAIATVKAGQLIFSPIGSGATPGGRPLPRFTIRRADGDQHRWRVAERDAYTGVTAAWRDVDGAQTTTAVAGDETNAKRLGRIFGSQAAAQRAAEAEWKRVQRGEATLAYSLAIGRPDLAPEQQGQVLGIKPDIDATTWLIDRVVHSLGDGLTTALELSTA